MCDGWNSWNKIRVVKVLKAIFLILFFFSRGIYGKCGICFVEGIREGLRVWGLEFMGVWKLNFWVGRVFRKS